MNNMTRISEDESQPAATAKKQTVSSTYLLVAFELLRRYSEAEINAVNTKGLPLADLNALRQSINRLADPQSFLSDVSKALFQAGAQALGMRMAELIKYTNAVSDRLVQDGYTITKPKSLVPPHGSNEPKVG